MSKSDKYQSFSEDISKYVSDLFFRDRRSQTFILHKGPTNSGKTYHALKAFEDATTGCYLSPLRLLAYEVYEDLNEQGYKCSLTTGEEKIIHPESTFLSATVEMCPTNECDVMIIDECSMIADKYRGEKWLRAILLNNAKQVHLILNEESFSLITMILDRINVEYDVREYNRLVSLQASVHNYELENLPKHCVVICFKRLTVHSLKYDLESMGRKVSIIYGALPPEVKKYEMNRFINGETDICVSTDAIGMGLNLPCRQIIFYEIMKYDGEDFRCINHFEAKQIAGRAGRYNQFKTGYFSAIGKRDRKTLEDLVYNDGPSFENTFMGLDYHILEKMGNSSLLSKLRSYDKMSLIPHNVRDVVHFQPNEKYLDKYVPTLEKFDLEVAFAFLRCPVKPSNQHYYESCISKAHIYNVIDPPLPVLNSFIDDEDDLGMVEKYLSEVDLYLSIAHDSILSQFVQLEEEIIENRNEFNQQVIDFLLRKRVRKIKRCRSCKTYLPISHRFPLCSTCYRFGL